MKGRKIIISGLDQTEKPKRGTYAKNPCPLCRSNVIWHPDTWEDDRETRILNEDNQRMRWICVKNMSCRWASDVEP
ncbi:MAG: hypothetical protein ABIH76_06360 [Candidatus Bathyarchaeota archaeon]